MMAKNRELRYANARALVQDLQTAQTLGDAGVNRLEAASFDRESERKQAQAATYGIETSVDGVAVVPELPGDSQAGAIRPPTPALAAPRRADYGVFRVAALLVILVSMATLMLVWLAPQQPLPIAQKWFARFLGAPAVVAPPPNVPEANPAPVPPVTPAVAPKPKPVVHDETRRWSSRRRWSRRPIPAIRPTPRPPCRWARLRPCRSRPPPPSRLATWPRTA
jgi:hypothetical protein